MFTLPPTQLEEAATGLRYLHQRDVVHGGLKGVRPSLPTPSHALTGSAVQHLTYQ